MYNYNQYNSSAFDNQSNDRNSQVFWDAVSMTSSDRNSIALSIYHSVPELAGKSEQYENDSHQNSKNEMVIPILRVLRSAECNFCLQFFFFRFGKTISQ